MNLPPTFLYEKRDRIAIMTINSAEAMNAFTIVMLLAMNAAFADEPLKNVVLAIEEPAGPEKYNINRNAEVTVVLYKERVGKANHSFAKGKLTEKDVEMVSAEIAQLVK